MSQTQYNIIARRFVEEIFNARKTEVAKDFVTPDIIYHGMAEEVRGLEEFTPATHKEIEAQGVEILHFEGDKIKEAWTIADMSVLAQ